MTPVSASCPTPVPNQVPNPTHMSCTSGGRSPTKSEKSVGKGGAEGVAQQWTGRRIGALCMHTYMVAIPHHGRCCDIAVATWWAVSLIATAYPRSASSGGTQPPYGWGYVLYSPHADTKYMPNHTVQVQQLHMVDACRRTLSCPSVAPNSQPGSPSAMVARRYHSCACPDTSSRVFYGSRQLIAAGVLKVFVQRNKAMQRRTKRPTSAGQQEGCYATDLFDGVYYCTRNVHSEIGGLA